MRSTATFAWDRLQADAVVAGRERPVAPLFALRVLLGGWHGLAWIVLAFSSVFVWAFDLPGAARELASAPTRPGFVVVDSVEPTHMRINKVTVMRLRFTYQHEGATRSGIAHRTGGAAPSAGAQLAAAIAVDGSVAVPDGWRHSEAGVSSLFIAFVPLAALGAILLTLAANLRKLSLLRRGVLTTGKLVERFPTNVTVNKQRVYRYVFRFRAKDGREYDASVRTHNDSIIRDEADEPLLYDAVNPARAVLLGDVPGNPRIEGGGFSPSSALPALATLLAPLLAIAVLAGGLLARC